MKKRIFSSMIVLTVVSLLAASVALCAVFYRQLSVSVQSEVRERAGMLKGTVTSENYSSLAVSDMRMTIIAHDGEVIYDSGQPADAMPNHSGREEIAEALETGTGESLRFSDTIGQETYYYAVKLSDGSVLRLAKTTDSIWGIFGEAVPVFAAVVLAVFIIGYILAGRLTKQIVSPINKVRIDSGLTAPYDELIPFVQTISAQRGQINRQIADLKNRSNTIEALMDSMSEGIILINEKGVILSVNKSACAIFSVSSSAEGRNILEILRDTELNEFIQLALSGTRSEINHIRSEKTYRIYFSPVTGSGALILFLDITEKAMAEKLRREFSANVSHELKTPLTTICGSAEMLENGMVKEEDKIQFYAKIKDEASRLIRLVEDIILLSQLDEDSGTALTENVNLADAAAAVTELLRAEAEKQNISIHFKGGGYFFAVRSQIEELLSNLIGNAVKYNKPGGRVDVDISTSDTQAAITVTDTGIGIPEEAQSRVFERFYRADKSRSKKTGGSGLGLAIAKHIVMAYDGSIELQSSPDKGTSISVILRQQT